MPKKKPAKQQSVQNRVKKSPKRAVKKPIVKKPKTAKAKKKSVNEHISPAKKTVKKSSKLAARVRKTAKKIIPKKKPGRSTPGRGTHPTLRIARAIRGRSAIVLEPNFEYTLVLVDGVTVDSLDINGTDVTDIKTSDKIYADRSPGFHVYATAINGSPTGSGTLQLKDLTKDKNVWDNPQPFHFSDGGNGTISLTNINLP